MIRAEWMRGAGSRILHIEGHAGSAEYGHDLICAAVSVLAQGLWENMQAEAALGNCRLLPGRMEPGNARIAAERCNEKAEWIFDAFCRALAGLARGYSDFLLVGEKKKQD